MIKPINMFKNAEQASILRTKAVPAAITPELRQLIEDLKDTCLAHPNCAGLSSNQIWADPVNPAPAVFVIRGAKAEVWPVINPVVEKQWKKEIKDNEGCMSFPGVVKKVVRPRHIAIAYTDVDGNALVGVDLFDHAARVFMHEYDHLQGILIEDK